jgi:hypothetical protein
MVSRTWIIIARCEMEEDLDVIDMQIARAFELVAADPDLSIVSAERLVNGVIVDEVVAPS